MFWPGYPPPPDQPDDAAVKAQTAVPTLTPADVVLCCQCKATTNVDDGFVPLTDHGTPVMCRPCYDRALRGFGLAEVWA